MGKMKVLHIARLKNDLTNGVSVVVPQYIIAQKELADVQLMDINNCHNADYTVPYNGVKSLEEYLDNNAVNLVIFHEVNNIENISLYKVLDSRKIPYVIVPHGEITKEALSQKWLKKKVAYILLFNRFIKHAKAIHFLSEAEKENSIFADKGFICPNGIDIPDNKKSFHKDNLNIVYVGRINCTAKGLDSMIKAIALIKDYCVENKVTFNLYGMRHSSAYFEQCNAEVMNLINDNGLEGLVNLYDAVFSKDKISILDNADYFVQTSRFEGMPLGVIEALAYGIPCILTKETAIGELAAQKGAAYCVEDGHKDVSNIANTIKLAIQGKADLEKMSKCAKEFAKGYDWQSIAKQTIEQYKKVIGE
ncbi:MAG: glycosyltransferase [Clostridia bacterium]|nr:glycosyltransferase [Clostridia bacterium]